ncbi:MAG TPA: hypothetical protein VFW78_02520 [Bacteroidia bacterium]|nr:hypothetical protein [Bacteroidia bacterium]
MRNKLLMLTLLLIPIAGMAQRKKATVESDTSFYWSVYRNAEKIGDPEVAKNALYQIIARTGNCPACYDSLAHIYYVTGAYSQSSAAAALAGSDKGNKPLLELKAYSSRNSGDLKAALAFFERLEKEYPGPEYIYQQAAIQFNMERYGECIMACSGIINDSLSAGKKIVITYESGKAQEVSYRAAAYNLRGVVFLTTKNKVKAASDFENALKLEPDFILAKNNLESANKE